MALQFLYTFIILIVLFFVAGLDAHIGDRQKERKVFLGLFCVSFYGVLISAILAIWGF